MRVLKKSVDTATPPLTTFVVDAEGARPGHLRGAVKLFTGKLLADSSVNGHEISLCFYEVEEAINMLRQSGRHDLCTLAGQLEEKLGAR